MNKYLNIFAISIEQEFAYKVNFIMWRLRNVIQIIIAFFLWDTLTDNSGGEIFGYDKDRILTYVLGLIFIKALVLSARAQDVAGEISRGEILNYLVRPVSYFKYWLTRDLSSKALNIIFATLEFSVFYLIFKPPFYFQTNIFQLLLFLISIVFAVLLYFLLLFTVNAIPFWAPEMGWGGQFLIIVILVEFFSGTLFPLDILPSGILKFLNLTPFPYLIFFPLQVYLGKITGINLIQGFVISMGWVFVLWFAMHFVWRKGLKVYQAYGR